MKGKKAYERPVVRKVRLEVKTSVLGTCNSSPNLIQKIGSMQCTATNCYKIKVAKAHSEECRWPVRLGWA